MTHVLTVIGEVRPAEYGFNIQIDDTHRQGLTGLDEFSHAIVIWLADQNSGVNGIRLMCAAPYTSSDHDIGVFASRSPDRPNPVCMSVVTISDVDQEKGIIKTPFIDALPHTTVLDIKPYFPASDLVSSARIPTHFAHWPVCYEDSASFDWDREFR